MFAGTDPAQPVHARVLIVACGALAREIRSTIELNNWTHVDLRCLPATLHNRPEQIAPRLDTLMSEQRSHYSKMFVAYADCGSGGEIDKVISTYGAERLPGAHCYAFLTGQDVFDKLEGDEIGTFWLTDFLARQFERLVWVGLGLDRHPDLLPMYFGHYTRLVYLAQTDDRELDRRARTAADKLGLRYERIETGLNPLRQAMQTGLETHSCHS